MTAVVSTSSTYAIRCGGTVNNQGKSAARGEFTRIISQCSSGSAAELGTRWAYAPITGIDSSIAMTPAASVSPVFQARARDSI